MYMYVMWIKNEIFEKVQIATGTKTRNMLTLCKLLTVLSKKDAAYRKTAKLTRFYKYLAIGCVAITIIYLHKLGMLILIRFKTWSSWYSLYAVPSSHFSLADCIFTICSVVLAFMRVSTSSLRKGLPTHPTLIRLLPRVGQFMLLETRHLGKPLCTPLEFAGIRPLSCVRSYVVL